MPICHPYFFLVKYVEIICLFELFSYYCVLRGLCILDVGLRCFAHLCSQSIFILLIVSFEEQKLLVLMKSNLSFFFFFFKDRVFGLASRKSFLSFTFRPMSPLELIFVCDAGYGLWGLVAFAQCSGTACEEPFLCC